MTSPAHGSSSAADQNKLRLELLRKKMASQSLTGNAPIHDDNPFSGMSIGMQRLWSVQQSSPQSTILNVGIAYALHGQFDTERYTTALRRLAILHPILTTTFVWEDNGSVTNKENSSTPAIEVISGAEMVDHEFPQTVEQIMQLPPVQKILRDCFDTPFNLSTDSPFRTVIIECTPELHIVCMVVHHIAWDDLSWEIFFTDMKYLYEHADHDESQLAPIPLSTPSTYSGNRESDQQYWHNVVSNIPDQVDLSWLSSQISGENNASSREAGHLVEQIPAPVLSQVVDTAKTLGCTPFALIMACFSAFIHRNSGVEELMLAMPVSLRGQCDEEKNIGYRGDVVLVRSELKPEYTVRQFFEHATSELSRVIDHSHFGIDAILRQNPALYANNDLESIVNISFGARNRGIGWNLPGITAEFLEVRTNSSTLPLTVMIEWDEERAYTYVEFQKHITTQEKMKTHIATFYEYMMRLLSSLDTLLVHICPLTEKQIQKELELSEGKTADFPATTLWDLVHNNLEHHPHKTALITDNTHISYAQMSQYVQGWQAILRQHNITVGDKVVILSSDTVLTITAALALFKEGAIYTPIDPQYSTERINTMVRTINPQLIIHNGHDEILHSHSSSYHTICITELPEPITADIYPQVAQPEHSAYIIFTSGSTGTPKPIVVSHYAISQHLQTYIAHRLLETDDRLLTLASIGFDASITELYGVLAIGAAVIIPPTGTAKNIIELGRCIHEHKATVMNIVPGLLDSIVATQSMMNSTNILKNLRFITLGGEALHNSLVRSTRALTKARLGNYYGPTESVVAVTQYPVTHDSNLSTVPIGYPLDNTNAYVLDRYLQCVPTGGVGELYIGRRPLAYGYYGQSSKTAERFVADPFIPGQRMYRTGDLARRGAHGEIHFVGRSDDQVKIRGYRIELGEIHNVVASHPLVRQTAVVTQKINGNESIIVAYVVLAQEDKITPPERVDTQLQQIKSFVASRLPDYMVPSVFQPTPTLIINSNGKVDRRALPPLEKKIRTAEEPRTQTERLLAHMFKDILGVEHVHRDDSFFELGGHSLLISRLVMQIRAEFMVEIPFRLPFDHPVMMHLAQAIDEIIAANDEKKPEHSWTPDRLLDYSRGDRDTVPVSSTQRTVLFEQQIHSPESSLAHIPLYIIHDNTLNLDALRQAYSDLIERHSVLRTVFPVSESANTSEYAMQQILDTVSTPWTDHSDQQLSFAQIQEKENTKLFTLNKEVGHRITVYKDESDQYILAVIFHHIITDHWSLAAFWDELEYAYEQRHAGIQPQWNHDALEYANYALWQKEWLSTYSASTARELSHSADNQSHSSPGTRGYHGKTSLEAASFWNNKLAHAPIVSGIPTDYERPEQLGMQGIVSTSILDAERSERLRAAASGYDISEFILLLSAMYTTYRILGAGSDIVFATPMAGREILGTHTGIGLYANMVPLRFTLEPHQWDKKTIISQVYESFLASYAHQELPTDHIVEVVNPRRSLRYNPLFQHIVHYRPAQTSENNAFTVVAGEFTTSFVDGSINLLPQPDGGYELSIVCNKELYSERTATLILNTLHKVLDQFMSSTPEIISEELLTDADREHIDSLMHYDSTHTVEHTISEEDIDPQEYARVRDYLFTHLAQLLDIEPEELDDDDNFFGTGADSVMALQLAQRAQAQDLEVTAHMLFSSDTLGTLVRHVVAHNSAKPTAKPVETTAPTPSPQMGTGTNLSADKLASITSAWKAKK